MFKKGDKVYSILRGWGEAVIENELQIGVKFECFSYIIYYMKDGRSLKMDTTPELYFVEPTITVPKRRVEHKGWINISNYPRDSKERFCTNIFPEKPAKSEQIGYTLNEITYFVEE